MILRARIVVPVSSPPIEDGAIRVVGDRITEVGRWRDLRTAVEGVVEDLGDAVVIPGLVNAHCHLDYTDLAGELMPPREFTDWIKSILAAKSSWGYSEFAASWLAGAAQLLRSGTTTVANIESTPPVPGDVRRVTPLRVIRSTGQRDDPRLDHRVGLEDPLLHQRGRLDHPPLDDRRGLDDAPLHDRGGLDDPRLGDALPPLWAGVIAREVERWGEIIGRPIESSEIEPLNQQLVALSEGVSATSYLAALEGMQNWARGVAAWFTDFDVLMLPTVPEPAFPLGRINAAAPEPFLQLLDAGALITYTLPFNATGQPAISVPLGMSRDGLPIGVQLIAPFGREDVLIRLASQLEAAEPWSGRRPPVAAT